MAKNSLLFATVSIIVSGLFSPFTKEAQAGFFNTSRFVEPGAFSLGIEPELTFSGLAGFAGNLKIGYGLSQVTHLSLFGGLGDGPRLFRIGAQGVLDVYPDLEDQPGIGLAFGFAYYRLKLQSREIEASSNSGSDIPYSVSGRLEGSLTPYIHNAFKSGASGKEIDPFLAIPMGIYNDNDLKFFAQIVVGSLFDLTENLTLSAELGVNVQNYFTSMSGGFAYYF